MDIQQRMKNLLRLDRSLDKLRWLSGETLMSKSGRSFDNTTIKEFGNHHLNVTTNADEAGESLSQKQLQFLKQTGSGFLRLTCYLVLRLTETGRCISVNIIHIILCTSSGGVYRVFQGVIQRKANYEEKFSRVSLCEISNLIVWEFSFYLCWLYDVWHRESPLEKGARGL